MRMWKISIGLDRPSKPPDRLIVTAGSELRQARVKHPGVGHLIAWTEAQGLGNMRLSFLEATDKKLTISDKGMCAGEISIQRQRLFTFGDALRRALGPYVDNSQLQMRACVVQGRGKGLGQLRFGCREGCQGIGRKEIHARQRVRSRRSDERLDIVGIGGERAIEKSARPRNISGDQTLIEPRQPLKIEVHRV